MKVILVDNFGDETVGDRVLVEGLEPEQAAEKAREYNDHAPSQAWWAMAVPNDHRLSRGIEDLV